MFNKLQFPAINNVIAIIFIIKKFLRRGNLIKAENLSLHEKTVKVCRYLLCASHCYCIFTTKLWFIDLIKSTLKHKNCCSILSEGLYSILLQDGSVGGELRG